jgi:ParB family chromosome partitioning protein
MSKFPKFTRLAVDEAEALAREPSSGAAAAVAASMSGRPQPVPPPVPAPTVEPAQLSGQAAANDSNVRDVPMEEIVVHKYNARRLPLSASELDKLTKSMKEEGQRTPVPGWIDENGRTCIIDGRRRHSAAKNGDMPTLRVEYIPKPASDREAYKLSRAYNVEREQQTPLDDSMAWRLLLEQGVYKEQQEIADDTGYDKTEVSRIIKLTEMPPRILELLNGQHHLLNLRMLTAIRQYFDTCGEEETKTLIISLESGELSSRDVDRLRNAHERKPVTRQRSTGVRNFAFVNGSANVKQFESARKVLVEVADVAEGLSLSELTEALHSTISKMLGGEREGK